MYPYICWLCCTERAVQCTRLWCVSLPATYSRTSNFIRQRHCIGSSAYVVKYSRLITYLSIIHLHSLSWSTTTTRHGTTLSAIRRASLVAKHKQTISRQRCPLIFQDRCSKKTLVQRTLFSPESPLNSSVYVQNTPCSPRQDPRCSNSLACGRYFYRALSTAMLHRCFFFLPVELWREELFHHNEMWFRKEKLSSWCPTLKKTLLVAVACSP